MLILVFGIDNVDKFAGAVVNRISVTESSTSFTESVVELDSEVVERIALSVSVSSVLPASVSTGIMSLGVEDEPIQGKVFVNGLVVVSIFSSPIFDGSIDSVVDATISETASVVWGVVLLNLCTLTYLDLVVCEFSSLVDERDSSSLTFSVELVLVLLGRRRRIGASPSPPSLLFSSTSFSSFLEVEGRGRLISM